MSILDHNFNYNIKEYSNDDLPVGKFFWFSGYEHSEKQNTILDELNDNQHFYSEEKFVTSYVEQNSTNDNHNPQINGFNDNGYNDTRESNTEYDNADEIGYDDTGYDKIGKIEYNDTGYNNPGYDKTDETGYNNTRFHDTEYNENLSRSEYFQNGRYFKLNGSVPDSDEEVVVGVKLNDVNTQPDFVDEFFRSNSNNFEGWDADNELEDDYSGGTWFGFAGRQRRAQSMENLLAEETMEKINLTEQFEMLDLLVLESFDDLEVDLPEGESKDIVEEEIIIQEQRKAEEALPEFPIHDVSFEREEYIDESREARLTPTEMSEGKKTVLDEFIEEVFHQQIVSSKNDEISYEPIRNKNKHREIKNNEDTTGEPTQRIFVHSKKSSESNAPSLRSKTSISITSKPKTKKLSESESVVSRDHREVKVFYQLKRSDSGDSMNKKSENKKEDKNLEDNSSDFIDAYLTQKQESEDVLVADDNALQHSEPISSTIPHSLKRQTHVASISSVSRDDTSTGDLSSSEDERNVSLRRNRSFRRSIVIEDEEGMKRRRKSTGGTCVSVFFTPVSPTRNSNNDGCRQTICQQFKEVLTQLDHMVVSETNFGKDFEAVKKLHSLFWEAKEAENKKKKNSKTESLSSVLNYLVVQEWPKIILGCLRKLKSSYPHVFQECSDVENIIYYSGHMPSLLRMNRTSSEFAVSVLFDGLLKAAINFTDTHEASREASCEDNLIGYLLEDVVPQLHNVVWGKVTAREMFFKSICDLVYNCAKTASNASYLIEHDCVNVFTEMRDETFGVVDARKVNMTMLLTLSFLIDDNNYDIIVPREDSIIRLLQFLDKSLEHSEHTYHDFKAEELTNCLTCLAGHNANKVLIVRNSGQEILHKLLKYAYNDSERIAACHALWNVAFSCEAKDILREMGKLMNLLRELKGSDNAILRRAASGILWECEEKYDIKGTREMSSAQPHHVMISYEYEAQPLVIGIRDELHRQGFKVWMNTDGEERSLQEIMTRGVERASVVIAAVTRKYKQAPHTFAEIDYAYKLRKVIIPVIIDVDFVPDGWLNELIQCEKTFDFSRRSMFNGSLDALLEYINEITGPQGNSDATRTLSNRSSGRSRNADVLTWCNSDVIDWLKENQLIRSVNNTGRLQKLTGLHLLMFFDLKKESPDYYYSVLDSHLGFKDVLDTLEFTYALDRLLGSERLI